MPRVSLPGGAGLAPEAGGDPGVAPRQLVGLEDLVGVQRGERDLGGADEEELVALDLVDHLPLAREEAGAVAAAPSRTRTGGHDRLEALGAQPLDREPDQGELDHHQVAEQVGEARARGLGRLLHLDPAVALGRGRGGRASSKSKSRRLADLAEA